MVGQILPGARRGVVHAVDGAQPVLLPVGAELPTNGIEYPVTKAYQSAGRLAHLRHHQLEGVQDAVDTGGGERRAYLLEQCSNLGSAVGVAAPARRRAYSGTALPHRRHRQGIAVVLGQQFGFLAGAHGFQIGIAQRVERAGLW